MTTRRALLSAALLAPLAGCNLPGSGPPPNLYTLTPKNTFDPNLPQVGRQLLIEQPTAAAGLNTPRIAAMRGPFNLDYFAGVAWTDRAPAMVHNLLIESFENSKRIVAVGRENYGLRADFLLLTELREFQIEMLPDDRSQAHVRLNAKLVQMPRRNIVGSDSFDVTLPAASNRFPDQIAAFDEALGRVLRHVVEWSLRGIAASQPVG